MFTHAYQPIIDVPTHTICSYEALLRGKNNESPIQIFEKIPASELMQFDQSNRNSAVKMASQLNLPCNLNLNFLPECLLSSDKYIEETMQAFIENNLSYEQMVIEITEESVINNISAFITRINRFRGLGIKFALDDFGAGYSGLNLLASFQPDIIKLDMQLIRDIDSHGPRQAIVKAIINVCTALGIDIIAEGIETKNEYLWLSEHNIHLFQGYLFASPGFESFPPVTYPNM